MSDLLNWFLGLSQNSTESSCQSVADTINDTMHKLIFMPPERNPQEIERLAMDPQFELRATSHPDIDELISILCAWPKDCKPNKCIIFSHGNAGDILSYAQYAKGMANRHQVLFVVYDYPGYGISSGKPTETSCCKSLELVVNHVKEQLYFEEKDTTLVGQSIGTGIVANYVGTHPWTRPIILISPYESIISVVCYSSMGFPFDKLKTYTHVANIKCPVKIIHGEEDDVIPIKHGKSLYQKLRYISRDHPLSAESPWEPVWLKGIGHNDILDAIPVKEINNVIYYESSKSFLSHFF